jgi:hypothetical protein
MMGRQEDKVKRGAAAYLESGEDLLAAVIARPRGSAINDVGGNLGPRIGGQKVHEAMAAGANAGLALVNPMALLVTTRRVVVLKIGSVFGLGIGGAVEGLVSSLPISAVDEIRVRRLLLGRVITVIVAGEEIKLEVGPGADARGISGAFGKLKAAVV